MYRTIPSQKAHQFVPPIDLATKLCSFQTATFWFESDTTGFPAISFLKSLGICRYRYPIGRVLLILASREGIWIGDPIIPSNMSMQTIVYKYPCQLKIATFKKGNLIKNCLKKQNGSRNGHRSQSKFVVCVYLKTVPHLLHYLHITSIYSKSRAKTNKTTQSPLEVHPLFKPSPCSQPYYFFPGDAEAIWRKGSSQDWDWNWDRSGCSKECICWWWRDRDMCL